MAKLLTYEEAAQELCVSVAWLKKEVQARRVPFRKLGHLTRFTEQDLQTIADQAAVAPIEKQRRGRR